MGIHSFPKGHGTLFASIYYIYIYQSWYIIIYLYGEFVLYVTTYLVMLVVQGNLIKFVMLAKYNIIHHDQQHSRGALCTVDYSLHSGHPESSQPFIVNCMFRPL